MTITERHRRQIDALGAMLMGDTDVSTTLRPDFPNAPTPCGADPAPAVTPPSPPAGADLRHLWDMMIRSGELELQQLEFKLYKAEYGMGMPRDEDNIARLKSQIANIQRSLERARSKAAS